jgi:hypothetical protein
MADTKPAEETVLKEAISLLRALLDAVERGELTAPGPMVSHLQGSLSAMEAVDRAMGRAETPQG